MLQLPHRQRLAGWGLAALVIAAIATPATLFAAPPPPIVFDTDLGNDVDDMLALAMLHALQSRGECQLLAVTVSKNHRLAASLVDAVNGFYGRGQIPVGLVRGGVTPEQGKFLSLAAIRDDDVLRYPHRFANSLSSPPPAIEVLRQTLANQPDGAVVIVQVGFSTNLAQLLESVPDAASPLAGRPLVRQKVRLLSVMAGAFARHHDSGDGPFLEYNVTEDVPSAQRLFADWPTPIVVSGYEIGRAIEYPARSIVDDFTYVAHHPVAEAYRLYEPPPHNRPTWDLTAVLQAVRPDRGYFGLSEAGQITVSDEGATTFRPAANGRHRTLTATAEQVVRVREAFVLLASQPPDDVRTRRRK